ncbi:LysR family transcriptional regulator [Bordetella petrii]|uniref:LysR family transcriptional regulator n=1 Tax=Bordetella petrii TaxID=94624 RepID=UPI001A95DDF6|nr:LysR substrate-binding domain-containing protein [Bordetella petrii]MBO1114196.1 LysR family transcriptional regulator [Bordetella petrii]
MMSRPISSRLSKLRVRHLALLEIVAESGSLRQAANALSVTQPAVTAMLHEQESLLGVKLVERDQQGARLTPAGEAVRERLRLVLNALQGVEATFLATPPRPHLRIGALSFALLDLIPKVLATLRQTRPDITFEFVEGTVEEMVAGIATGDFDCAMGRLGSEFHALQGSDIEFKTICNVPMKIACAKHHPIRKRASITLETLQQEGWILLPQGTGARRVFERAFSQKGLIPPFPTVESMSFVSNFHLAAATNLLTISTATAVEEYCRYGLVAQVDIQWPVSLAPLMFFARKDALELESVQTFYKCVEMHSKTLL